MTFRAPPAGADRVLADSVPKAKLRPRTDGCT
jgi:hypothetical protein